jgi:hypothetical protein
MQSAAELSGELLSQAPDPESPTLEGGVDLSDLADWSILTIHKVTAHQQATCFRWHEVTADNYRRPALLSILHVCLVPI